MNHSPKDLETLLAKLGIASGEWKTSDEKPVQMPLVQTQIETLTKLRDYLSGVAETDTQTVARLREQLIRLQRGGGV